MLFLSFITGANVHNWVNTQVIWLSQQLTWGNLPEEEYLYDTVMDKFCDAYTDTMSVQKAKRDIRTLKMEKGDIDTYVAEFEKLARMANYTLDEPAVLEQFIDGLPQALVQSIIGQDDPISWRQWVESTHKHQQKYLYLQGHFRSFKKTGKTQEQWHNAFSKKKDHKDPNAMDTTLDRIRTRVGITDEEKTQLMKEGKCFKCKKQGHMS